MFISNKILKWFALGIFVLLVSLPTIGYQEKKKELPQGTPALWREPADLASRNLYLGPGGESMKPDLSKVTLIEEKESSAGTAKYRVRDGSNREWVVKVGGEVQAETAASRIVWAAGYYTDTTYLVPRAEIQGVGVVENAKFEARAKGIKRLDEWLWDDNPFVGTTELQSLKLLLVMLDNWNIKNENTEILYLRETEAGAALLYIISDVDMKNDKSGTEPSLWYKRGKSEESSKAKFVEKGKDGSLIFGYSGKHKERLANITVTHAKWLSGLLSRLSDQQIQDACRASNYSPEETQIIAKTIRARINELANLK